MTILCIQWYSPSFSPWKQIISVLCDALLLQRYSYHGPISTSSCFHPLTRNSVTWPYRPCIVPPYKLKGMKPLFLFSLSFHNNLTISYKSTFPTRITRNGQGMSENCLPRPRLKRLQTTQSQIQLSLLNPKCCAQPHNDRFLTNYASTEPGTSNVSPTINLPACKRTKFKHWY
jgi:hypothetical protein